LCNEIRKFLIENVSKTGGHMGSNLGVVELTVALHYVFDCKKDLIVWDISNQTYTHKILTGRRQKFHTLRQYQGISGFACKDESPYDPFSFGHAGTSISVALGAAVEKKFRKVIVVIGDGGLTEGVAYEGLNNCGYFKKDLLVILNDNQMSISPTIGAMTGYLSRIRTAPLYQEVKSYVKQILRYVPFGTLATKLLKRIRDAVREAALGMNIFSALGFKYYGPIDGHNLPLLIKSLQDIKRITHKPVLLHIITKKAKGHPEAEKHPFALHAVAPPKKEGIGKQTFTQAFSNAIVNIAQKDKKVVAITAAMPDGTGLLKFANMFPERFYDVGISEQHAVAFSAGLAFSGLRPVVAIYSTFLQRAYDQIFQEACLQKLPIIFVMDRAGLVGEDGPTHHGPYDIAYLRALPEIILMAPKDGVELQMMLEFALTLNKPVAIRYPKSYVPDFSQYGFAKVPVRMGESEKLFEGEDVALLCYGSMVEIGIKVRQMLLEEKINCAVVNARFAKPVDKNMVVDAVNKAKVVLTLEEHSIKGGFGSAVLEEASLLNLNTQKVKTFAIPDTFIKHATREKQLEMCGLTPQTICERIKGWL
jgi:1-deoxy-D-xylulose-5-phosphate synthase